MNKNSKCQETQFTVYTKINKYQQTHCRFFTQGQRVWVISNDSGWEYSGLLKASATENVEGLQGLPAKRRLAGIVTISAYRGCSNNSLKGGRYGIPKPLQLCLPRAGCGQNYVVCFCLIPSSLFVFVRCCQFRLFVLWVCLLLSDVVCFIIGFVWYHQLLFLLSLILFVCVLCWAPLPASPSSLSSLLTSLFLPPSLPFSPIRYASRSRQAGGRGR